MNDMIIKAAQDPSCLLAVTPDRGGSWWAALRTDTPRNFAENPMTWTDAMTAANQIGSDDWSFQIKMNVLSQIQQTSGEIFNNDSGSPLKIYGDLIASGSAAFYLRNYVELETWTGTHKLQLDVVSGNATLYVDGTLVATKPTGLSTLNFTRASKTSADIEIESVEFLNLTTGETVWQASRDDLFETNNPWPSATLRNFDDVTAAWYDAVAVGYAAIGDHDCEFEISYKNNVDYPGTIFYSNSQAGSINLHQIKNNHNSYSSFRAFNGEYPDVVIALDNGIQTAGSHTVKFKRQNGTAEAWVDGQLVESVTSDLGNKPLYAENVPASHFDGNIFYIRLTDLTTGKTVWSYPSEAERVRLLTKTNVRTDRGVFEAADTSRRWDVTTQLRAASLLPECTIIVEADNPNGELATIISCAQRSNPAQGFFVIRKQEVEALLFGYSGKNSSGAMVYPNRYIRYPDGKHVFAFVLDYSALQLRIYIDGAEVDNRAMDVNVVAPPEFDGTEKPVILGATSTSDGLNSTTKISHCLVFDRALTAAEIAAFGVRRPRNFAEKTMMWTDAKTALDTIDQSHDFTFEIEFKCVKTNAVYVFASDESKDFIRVFMSNGTVIVNTALLGTSSGGSTQFSAGSDSTNRHVLTVKFTGNTITASVDSEVVYTRENLFRNVIEIGTPHSNAGYVYKISLTDDTAGETVWRANHNDLFTY